MKTNYSVENWLGQRKGLRTERRVLYLEYLRKSNDDITPNEFYRILRKLGYKEVKGVTRDFKDCYILDNPILKIHDKSGYVYFITDGELVNIGCSKDVPERLNALQVSTGKRLLLLKSIYFDYKIIGERMFHNLFEKKRVRGEWYDILYIFQ